MMDFRSPLSLRNVEDLLHERGIGIAHETVRFWWNRFGTIFAAEIRRRRVAALRHFRNRRWYPDEVFMGCCQSKLKSLGKRPTPAFLRPRKGAATRTERRFCGP